MPWGPSGVGWNGRGARPARAGRAGWHGTAADRPGAGPPRPTPASGLGGTGPPRIRPGAGPPRPTPASGMGASGDPVPPELRFPARSRGPAPRRQERSNGRRNGRSTAFGTRHAPIPRRKPCHRRLPVSVGTVVAPCSRGRDARAAAGPRRRPPGRRAAPGRRGRDAAGAAGAHLHGPAEGRCSRRTSPRERCGKVATTLRTGTFG